MRPLDADSLQSVLAECVDYPNTQVLIACGRYADMQDITSSFIENREKLPMDATVTSFSTHTTKVIFINGSEISIVAGGVDNLRGRRCDYLLYDETINEDDILPGIEILPKRQTKLKTKLSSVPKTELVDSQELSEFLKSFSVCP